MTATIEAAAFRARIQHQRRARRYPQAMYFLTTAECQAKKATIALLAARANRARARYESAAFAGACEAQRARLAHLSR